MNLKTYQAYSMGEVLSRIRKDLGEQAVVLHTRTFKRGGLLGIGARTVYEVTATDSRRLPEKKRKQSASSAGNGSSSRKQQSRTGGTSTSTSTKAAADVTMGTEASRPKESRRALRATSSATTEKVSDQLRSNSSAQNISGTDTPSQRKEDLLAALIEAAGSDRASSSPTASKDGKTTESSTRPNVRTTKNQPTNPPRSSREAMTTDDGSYSQFIHQPSPKSDGRPPRLNRPDGAPVPLRRANPLKRAGRPNRPMAKSDAATARRFIVDPETGRVVPAAPRSTVEKPTDGRSSTEPLESTADRDDSPLLEEMHESTESITPDVPVEVANEADVAMPDSKPAATGSESDAEIRGELAALREMVTQVLAGQSKPAPDSPTDATEESEEAGIVEPTEPAQTMHEVLFQQYLALMQHEVEEELAKDVCETVQRELTSAQLEDADTVRERIVEHLTAYIPAAESSILDRLETTDGRPLTMALIGPTGVGKTTTVAKLAAAFKLRDDLQVGLITTDTYRIAAVDQLRTYANIIGVPLKVAISPKEIAAACHALRDVDVILIDTAGRSPNDTARIDEIHSFLDAAQPHESHLVLSSASSEPVLIRTIERFSSLPTDRIIFTKLDEAVHFGVIVNVMQKVGKRLSFVTTGQEVPDQIEPGEPRRLAQLILGESANE